MKKTTAMITMLFCLGALFGGIFLYKWYKSTVIKKLENKNKNSVVYVSSTLARKSIWTSEIHVVGSTRTVKGVNVTPELAGMVTSIHFKPGSEVIKGQLLVQLDIKPDIAKLHQLQAKANIAGITYRRDLKQYRIGGVSKETVDKDEANYKSAIAQVEEQKAIIDEKTVRAPFTGKIGINLVNLGQYLNPGDTIANLQTLRPIYVDFYVPQQQIPKLKVGLPIKIKIDAYSKESFEAPITTINPLVDKSVRNILIEATLPNTEKKVLPGMYVYVNAQTGESHKFITLPQAAISFNPYGSIIYRLKPTKEKYQGNTVYTVEQKFVKTGDTRGNQIAILSGVNTGDKIVTSGQIKIKNGSRVVINNKIQPPSDPTPSLPTE